MAELTPEQALLKAKVVLARKLHRPPLTSTELAGRLTGGVNAASYRRWESQGSFPHGKLEDVARALKIDPDYFFDGDPDSEPVFIGQYPPANAMATDPSIAAGFAVTAAIRSWSGAMAGLDGDSDHFQQDPEPHEVPTAFLIGGTAKIDLHDVVRITGVSMYPRIEPGDRVIFFRDSAQLSNSIVLVQSPENEVYVKTIRREGSLVKLDSLGEGACFTDLKGWQILGHAICIMGRADGSRRNIEWDDGRYLKA